MRKSSIQPFLLCGLFAASTTAFSRGYYEYIPYYGNDPFLFCTEGVPQDCWAPINPATGTYAVTDEECFNPASASLYARVCPKAFSQQGF